MSGESVTKIQTHSQWVIVGGCCLAFLGAAVNASFLIKLGTSVSHLTGDISNAAIDTVMGRSQFQASAFKLLTAAIGFVLGAATSGYYIHHPGIEFGRPYGRSVTAIGFCLLVAHFLLPLAVLVSIFLASFACGFQNALATRYKGLILRTTHVTGLLTDLGTILGMMLRGHQIATWKLLIPSLLVFSFFAGALFGTVLVVIFQLPALLILATLYIIGGIGWSIYKHHFLTDPPHSESGEP